MGKRKEESDSDYVPSSSTKKKKKASSSALNVATSTAIVSVESQKKEWTKQDIEALVKEGIKAHFQEDNDRLVEEEKSVVVGLKTYLAAHHCDLDWFDNNESDRDDLISKWVDSNIMDAKYRRQEISFLTSMNDFKLKSFKAFKRNLP